MKLTVDKIFPRIGTATLLALSVMSVASLPASAIEVPQRVINGLYRTSAEDFFREGHRRFEREIQILQQRRLASEQPILDVSEQQRIQEQLSPLEMRNLSPGNNQRRNIRKYRDRR